MLYRGEHCPEYLPAVVPGQVMRFATNRTPWSRVAVLFPWGLHSMRLDCLQLAQRERAAA